MQKKKPNNLNIFISNLIWRGGAQTAWRPEKPGQALLRGKL